MRRGVAADVAHREQARLSREEGETLDTTLTDEMQRLPAQPISATRVLRMVDDPNASTADLARLVETDPALSAQVMRLANSPYYGLSNSIGSAGRAVMLLGFTTVRALAVSAACALLSQTERVFPPGFWPHGVSAAVGSAAVARRVGVAPSEAFSAGLLHDIGAALLHRRDPDRYQRVVDAAGFDSDVLLALERKEYGTTHTEVGAQVTTAWRLPPAFVRTVRNHHRPPHELNDSLSRVVIAGEVLGRLVDGSAAHEPTLPVDEVLAAAGLKVDPGDLLAEMRREIAQLAWFLEIDA